MIYVKIQYMDQKAWDAVDWDIVRSCWPGSVPEEKPSDKYAWWVPDPVRVTYEEASSLAESGLALELVPAPNAMLTKMQEGKRRWSYGETVNPRDLNDGSAIQITIPDLALLLIDEVTWLDDACTQEVQRHLEEGWRILAVCPPNAQRRPDYILGRRKAK